MFLAVYPHFSKFMGTISMFQKISEHAALVDTFHNYTMLVDLFCINPKLTYFGLFPNFTKPFDMSWLILELHKAD